MITPKRFPIRAFTLIELLTVIAIVGILASILTVTIGKVRETTQNAITVSNLRQIIMADLAHAADNRHLLIPNYPAADMDGGWWQSSQFLAYLGYDNPGPGGWSEFDNGAFGSHWRLNAGSNENFPPVLRSGRNINVKGWDWCPPGAFGLGMNMTCGTTQWDGSPMPQFDQSQWFAWKIYANQVRHPEIYIRWGESAEWAGVINYTDRNGYNPANEDGGSGALAFRSNNRAAVAYVNGSIGFVTRADINDGKAERRFKPLAD